MCGRSTGPVPASRAGAAATLASAAQSWQGRIGVDLLWITNEVGELLVSSSEKRPSGRSIVGLSPLREAIESEEATAAIGQVDGTLFQLVAVPVFGPDVIGFLLLAATTAILVGLEAMGLDREITLWLAPLIVGGIVALVGYGLVQKGISTLKHESLVPEKTTGSIQENKQWLQDKMS